jgi:hypothetical protein
MKWSWAEMEMDFRGGISSPEKNNDKRNRIRETRARE